MTSPYQLKAVRADDLRVSRGHGNLVTGAGLTASV